MHLSPHHKQKALASSSLTRALLSGGGVGRPRRVGGTGCSSYILNLSFQKYKSPDKIETSVVWAAPTRRGNRHFKLFKLPTKFKNTKAPIKSRLLWCGPAPTRRGNRDQTISIEYFISNISFSFFNAISSCCKRFR